MGFLSYVKLGLTRPDELRTLIQYSMLHEPKRDITKPEEYSTSGYDRESMRACWDFLDQTSRSFSAVIKELDGDLARTVCIYYLVLRGLDTIEDDMSISNDIKLPLLRDFHKKLSEPGWTFNGNGPDEKDRELLVQYNVVVTEMRFLDPVSRKVITDACRKMGAGMADFAACDPASYPIRTSQDYDLYCHYVAGIVGEGLSGLFVSTKKEPDFIGDQLVLSNSLGLLLQKTNILRDYREDVDDERHFWPKCHWERFGFTALAQLHSWCENGPKQVTETETDKDRAMWALSAMCLDGLRHTTDALDYLSLLRNQSVFNFCAIPAVMALATISLCFMNPDVFRRNVKIRKGEALRLIMRSTNPRDVAYMIRGFTRELHAKLVPADPSFLAISITCGKIEQWCEHRYPSFIVLRTTTGGGSSHAETQSDARLRIIERQEKLLKRRRGQAAIEQAAIAGGEVNGVGRLEHGGTRLTAPPGPEGLPWVAYLLFIGAFGGIIALCLLVVWMTLTFFPGDEVVA